MLRMTEIGDFIADRSPAAAARVIASLFDRVAVLADHPQLGIVFLPTRRGGGPRRDSDSPPRTPGAAVVGASVR